MNTNNSTIVALTGLLLLSAFLRAQEPVNFDFETKSVEGAARPWGWAPFQYAPNTVTNLDSSIRYEGRFSLCIRNSDEADDGAVAQQVLGYWLAPRELSGKNVSLLGMVRTEKPRGFAQVTLAAYGDSGLISEVKSDPFDGGKVWRQFRLQLKEAAPAHSWFVIISSAGAGAVWFDDFRLVVEGHEKQTLEVAADFDASQRNWLKKQCRPLLACQPDSAVRFSDLQFLRKTVGDARIIALGEATHGTSEFFTLKHRLLQYGVGNLEVRAFAIEANQLEVEKINRYVRDGVGSAADVIQVMFRVWNTTEMLELIEWLRNYNRSHPDKKVSFVGFDLQDPSLPMDSLSQFLADRDPSLRRLVDSLQRDYREAWRAQYYPQAADSVKTLWKNNAEKVWAQVSDRKAFWLSGDVSKAAADRVEWAVQNARVVCQAATIAWSGAVSARDTFMAENIRWLLSREAPRSRMIVWAHDSHIARSDHPDDRYNYHGGQSMGRYLSKMFGKDYKAFGLFTAGGQYSATISYSNHRVVPVDAMQAPRGSLDEALHGICAEKGWKELFIDLRPALTLRDNAWILQPRPVRFVGYAASDFDFGALTSIPHQFDGVFFIDKTSASKMLR